MWRFSERTRAGIAGICTASLLLAGCSNDDDADAPPSGGREDEEIVTHGVGDRWEATIVRTTDGVPHITGDSLADVAFGQGWASGEDRTCDLADQVVKVRGERARFFGAGDENANVNSDVAWRAIGIFERASDDWQDASETTREAIEAFTAGWNAHLREVGVDGVSGWCRGMEFVRELEPVEVYAYARSVALNASGVRLARYIPTAQPPTPEAPEGAGAALRTGSDTDDSPFGIEMLEDLAEPALASNAWAIGSERSASGGGMLLANPHFPWEGELRFWESHLTIPGEVDIYGAMLSGLPGIGIGFNENFGWSHTVSAGNRFTAYRLDLVDGDPTKYHYGDEVRDLVPTIHTIEVRREDGSIDTVEHTTWSSHWGPVIDFPGFGWTDQATITYRDANIDNTTFLDQYLAFTTAKDFDEFREINRTYQATPLFNTIAASADGRVWYADISATPNLSPEALAAYEATLEADPIVKIAADNGAVLLDGSDPVNEWVVEEGARSPGLVPWDRLPKVERADYVFNANDSFWMPHATETLEGDYSILHGRQRTPRSPRTRENAWLLSTLGEESPSGEDGRFSLEELADAALLNVGYTARVLRESVVDRCDGVAEVEKACDVLADWDGRYDLDSSGAALWREFISQYTNPELREAGALWLEDFDPARPASTPAGLAPAPADGPDPVIERLATAAERLEEAGFAIDVPLGEIQFANRNGQRIGLHGGTGKDGTVNIVTSSVGWSILDPALRSFTGRETISDDSDLGRGEEGEGYYVNYGNSFVLALAYGPDGPKAKAFLTYSNTEDRTDPNHVAATQRFAEKNWRDVAFRADDVEATATGRYRVRG